MRDLTEKTTVFGCRVSAQPLAQATVSPPRNWRTGPPYGWRVNPPHRRRINLIRKETAITAESQSTQRKTVVSFSVERTEKENDICPNQKPDSDFDPDITDT